MTDTGLVRTGDLIAPPTPPQQTPEPTRSRRPGRRGWARPGGGWAQIVQPPAELRATTVQAAGWWPWAQGAPTPPVGIPIGRHLGTGAAVCADPLSYFADAQLIGNPSVAILGSPGLGKSTLVRRWVIGMAAAGVTPLILGDLKPDYADVVRALGGQVVKLGRGVGSLNVLDLAELESAADRLESTDARAAARVRDMAHARRLNVVTALLQLTRSAPVPDVERVILSAALKDLIVRWTGANAPLLTDLITVLRDRPETYRAVAEARDDAELRDLAAPLIRSLHGVVSLYGELFAAPTTTRIALDAPAIDLDISAIDRSDGPLEAAVLLASWSFGYGVVEAANVLADCGLAPQRRFFVVLDELWRALRGGPGMVDRVDETTRLNRNDGVAQALITHTLADYEALHTQAERAKAAGFVERAGMLVLAGTTSRELDRISAVVQLNAAERALVESWKTPEAWDTRSEPPGRGNFLLKVGSRAGIPFRMELMPAEQSKDVHNTNRRWQQPAPEAASLGSVDVAAGVAAEIHPGSAPTRSDEEASLGPVSDDSSVPTPQPHETSPESAGLSVAALVAGDDAPRPPAARRSGRRLAWGAAAVTLTAVGVVWAAASGREELPPSPVAPLEAGVSVGAGTAWQPPQVSGVTAAAAAAPTPWKIPGARVGAPWPSAASWQAKKAARLAARRAAKRATYPVWRPQPQYPAPPQYAAPAPAPARPQYKVPPAAQAPVKPAPAGSARIYPDPQIDPS